MLAIVLVAATTFITHPLTTERIANSVCSSCKCCARHGALAMSESDEQATSESDEAPTKGRKRKRIGGVVRRDADDKETAADVGDGLLSKLPAAVALLLLLNFARGLLFPPTSFSYSVSTYSETTILREDDGSGQPKYETKRESSFKTNIPGLAEKMASEGREPAVDRSALPGLFPF